MEKEPRKATDVLLELESKIEVLLNITRNQDLNIKLLSNKLNSVLEKLEKNASNSKIVVEAVNTISPPEKNIPISNENTLPLETNPKGFRRTSRPETFEGDNSFLNKSVPTPTVTFPMQLPNAATVNAEVVVPDMTKINVPRKEPPAQEVHHHRSTSIPLVQRVVDKNGKSVFLADVEIINTETGESVSKTRTNGTGKWMATLPVGVYKAFVRKRESLTKEKVEAIQEIKVDGLSSTLELPMMILKI